MKKYLAAAALSASVAGVAMAAAPAMALADDGGTTSASGNG
ncbi:RdlA protein, partial [Streptomyces sp. SID11233]|nr:RdlA protein [Streptomyces sp. SID11233]